MSDQVEAELPQECDFCDRALDEDEELTPIYVGSPPGPRPAEARATAEKQRKVVGRRADPDSDLEVLDRPLDEIVALLKAIDTSDRFTLEAKQAVAEVYATGEEQPVQFDTDVNYDKVGVTLRAEPKPSNQVPDMMVCEFCAEGLSGND